MSTVTPRPGLPYEMLKDSILGSMNAYENAHGIKTVSIEEHYHDDDTCYFWVRKSDNTITLVIAFRYSRRIDAWQWIAPTDNQVKSLKYILPTFYQMIDRDNSRSRGGAGEMGGPQSTHKEHPPYDTPTTIGPPISSFNGGDLWKWNVREGK